MSNKLKYPKVFAAKEILDNEGYLYNLHDNNHTYGYAVAEAYLVTDTKTYRENGDFIQTYGIVYTWEQYSCIDNNGENEAKPIFNLLNGECINQIIVNKIFDNYNDCKEYTNKLNKELFLDKVGVMSFSNIDSLNEKIELLKETHNQNLQKYVYSLEQKHNANYINTNQQNKE